LIESYDSLTKKLCGRTPIELLFKTPYSKLVNHTPGENRMKYTMLALATAASVFLANGANAADVTPTSPDTDWSGIYFGVHAGFGQANLEGVFDSDQSDREDKVLGDDFDLNGVLGGGQVGYNYQTGSWVLGVEGDFSFLNYSQTVEDQDDEDPATDHVDASVDWLGSVRARAGIAVGTALIYGTGGIAFASGEWNACDCDDSEPVEGSADLSPIGFVAGGGIEVALGEAWSLRTEGLYYGFNEDQDTSDLNDDSAEDDFAGIDDVWVGRIGINYRFGSGF